MMDASQDSGEDDEPAPSPASRARAGAGRIIEIEEVGYLHRNRDTETQRHRDTETHRHIDSPDIRNVKARRKEHSCAGCENTRNNCVCLLSRV